jgi:hypothetical protein
MTTKKKLHKGKKLEETKPLTLATGAQSKGAGAGKVTFNSFSIQHK